MEQSNKISILPTEEKVAAINEKIKALRDELKELLVVNLTAEDRSNMLHMGGKSVDFVNKSLDYAGLNLPLVPAYLNLDEAKKDLSLVRILTPIIQELNTMSGGLEDLSMVAGSEAYDAALIFYHSLKGANRSQVSGANTIYQDLKSQFPRATRKKE